MTTHPIQQPQPSSAQRSLTEQSPCSPPDDHEKPGCQLAKIISITSKGQILITWHKVAQVIKPLAQCGTCRKTTGTRLHK